MWDVPKKGSCLEVGKEVCGGSDDVMMLTNKMSLVTLIGLLKKIMDLRPDRLDTNPEIVNDNVLSLETMNDCDDNFICDDFEVENEALHDYSNEEELSSDNESVND